MLSSESLVSARSLSPVLAASRVLAAGLLSVVLAPGSRGLGYGAGLGADPRALSTVLVAT